MSVFLLFAAVIVPSGEVFACTPTAVWDGDGPVWCAEGPRIRLSGIAARELDGSCSAGHPCPDADPIEARDALVELVGRPVGEGRHGHALVEGPPMRCVSAGSAGGDRTGAWCVSPMSGDISCAMVQGGWAARWERYWGDQRCH
jgi:endonuclease YncB( thermonuclease family)